MADVLVLGGTGFVGSAVVVAAQRQGHAVTSLTRGRTSGLASGVRSLSADRDDAESLGAALAGESFDAVIDVSGLAARRVRTAARLLADRVQHYALVSTISVYDEPAFAGPGPVPVTASTAVGDAADPSLPDMAHYSAQKRGAELALDEVLGADRSLVARPTFILGPGENVHRMSYWLSRGSAGGDVLGPGSASYPLQFVDVADLAEWLVSGAVAGVTGTHNVANAPGRDSWADWLSAVRAVTGSAGAVEWIPDDFLLAQGVTPNFGLPMWIPGGMPLFDVSSALATGFRGRPVHETVSATWEWWRSLPPEQRGSNQGYRPAPLTADQESALLTAYRAAHPLG